MATDKDERMKASWFSGTEEEIFYRAKSRKISNAKRYQMKMQVVSDEMRGRERRAVSCWGLAVLPLQAGVVVHNDPTLGIVVLTSQEKWDRTKAICQHWAQMLDAGHTELPFRQL